MASDISSPFANGTWAWDGTTNGLIFNSRDARHHSLGLATLASGSQASKKVTGISSIRFKDTIDNLGQAIFRRQFQRRIRPNEPQIVNLQDIKDVAIYTAERQDLTLEFIEFMHTKKMDHFLRSLIVYFQYFCQVWDTLQHRRAEAKKKLRQPIVTILEDAIRDNLSDLRTIVARNFGYIILGLDETRKHYHLLGANSLSDKDRHLYECLLSMSAKIVWISLLRKNFSLIEMELNQMFRTKFFNIMMRVRRSEFFKTNAVEDRVILGKAYTVEKKLKHRSLAIQEIVFGDHSYKLLAIGQIRVEPLEDRFAYLEIAYTAPEELLFPLNVGVGILGLSKDYLNPILMPKEGMAKRIHLPPWKLPVFEAIPGFMATETLPTTPPRFIESERVKFDRQNQCKLWRRYVAGLTKGEEMLSLNTMNIESGSRSLLLSSN